MKQEYPNKVVPCRHHRAALFAMPMHNRNLIGAAQNSTAPAQNESNLEVKLNVF